MNALLIEIAANITLAAIKAIQEGRQVTDSDIDACFSDIATKESQILEFRRKLRESKDAAATAADTSKPE